MARGRKPINTPKPDDIIKQEVICPNCKILIPIEYQYKDYGPVYGECSFCQTKWRWTLTHTDVIIPADKIQYLTIKIERE